MLKKWSIAILFVLTVTLFALHLTTSDIIVLDSYCGDGIIDEELSEECDPGLIDSVPVDQLFTQLYCISPYAPIDNCLCEPGHLPDPFTNGCCPSNYRDAEGHCCPPNHVSDPLYWNGDCIPCPPSNVFSLEEECVRSAYCEGYHYSSGRMVSGDDPNCVDGANQPTTDMNACYHSKTSSKIKVGDSQIATNSVYVNCTLEIK